MTDKKEMEKLLKDKIKYESDNGYPSFRNEIVEVLEFRYSIDSIKAKQHVWDPFISEKIMNDIEWAQHMGPSFWAKYIHDELIENPRGSNIRLQPTN